MLVVALVPEVLVRPDEQVPQQARAVEAARARAGLTQMQLAVATGVAISKVSRWECDSSEPSRDSLRAVVRVLG